MASPPGARVRTIPCCRLATTWPPALRTRTTGERTLGANPASGRMRWLPPGTTMPSLPAACTSPASVNTVTDTVADTVPGLLSVISVKRPMSVAPPTSQVSAAVSAHSAAANPANPPADTDSD